MLLSYHQTLLCRVLLLFITVTEHILSRTWLPSVILLIWSNGMVAKQKQS